MGQMVLAQAHLEGAFGYLDNAGLVLRVVTTLAPHLGFVGSGKTLKGHQNIPKGLHLLK